MVLRNVMYSQRAMQHRPARHFQIIIENDKLGNGNFNPKGEQYKHEKLGKEFKCAEYDKSSGTLYEGQNLAENLNVTNSGVIIYSDDFRLVDRKISRGDKIEYEDDIYSVFDFRYIKRTSKSQFQRKPSNRTLVLSLT